MAGFIKMTSTPHGVTSQDLYNYFRSNQTNPAVVPYLKRDYLHQRQVEGETRYYWRTDTGTTSLQEMVRDVVTKYNEEKGGTAARKRRAEEKRLKRAAEFVPLTSEGQLSLPLEQKPMDMVVKTLEDKIRSIDAQVVSTQQEINDLSERLEALRQQREEYYTALDVLEKLNK